MNLKNLKKVHEDEHVALFRSKEGHECRVSKKGLSEKLRKELSALPLHASDGVDTLAAEEFEPGKDYSQEPLPGDANSSSNSPDKVEKKSEPMSKRIGKLIGEYGVAPVMQGVKDTVGAYGKVASGFSEAGRGVAEGAGLARTETSVKPAAPAMESDNPQQEQYQEKDASYESDDVPIAPVTQKSAPIEAPKQTPEQVGAAYKQEADQEAAHTFQDLLNGHITPKTYKSLYNEESTLGKIGTIFGLLLSGAGGGLSGQPNAVLEMMNKEIDRDLDAQRKSVEGAQNFYQMNIQKELNAANITKAQAETMGVWKDIERKALENSKTQLELSSMHHLMTKANLLPPADKARAAAAISGIQGAVAQGIDKRNTRAAEQQALRALGHLGMVPGAQNIADANDARYVPGVGEAGIAVPESVRKELGSHQALEDAGKSLLKYSKTHTNLIKGTPEYNAGVTKAEAFRQTIRAGLLGTVYRDSEDGLLKKFMDSNPAGAFKILTTQPKLRALLEVNTIGSNALKKQYDLPTEKSGSAPPRYDPATRKYWTLDRDGNTVEAE